MKLILLFIFLVCGHAIAAPTLTPNYIAMHGVTVNMSAFGSAVSVGSKVVNAEVNANWATGGADYFIYSNQVPDPSAVRTTYGPLWYKNTFWPSNVNINNTISYNGMTYYKMLNVADNDIYVAWKQVIYDYKRSSNTWYTAPFVAQDYSEWWCATNSYGEMNLVNNSRSVSGGSCGEDRESTSISIPVRPGENPSNGTLYFYFPKKPTKTVVFNNYRLADMNITNSMLPGYQNSYPGDGTMTPYLQILLTGSLTFNNACRVSTNGGMAVEVPLGALSAGQFTTKGALPNGYTAKTTTIDFSCDNDIPGTYGSDSIKWSINAATESTSSEASNGILKAVAAGSGNTINNLGVQLKSPQNSNNTINATGAVDYPTTISGKKATAQITAYPTMINSTKPSGAGDFKATATVTFNIP